MICRLSAATSTMHDSRAKCRKFCEVLNFEQKNEKVLAN